MDTRRILKIIMKTVLFFGLLMIGIANSQIKEIRIGILAPMGKEETLKSWQGFKNLVQSAFTDKEIVLIPVNLEEFQEVAKNGQADLLIGNQTAFLTIVPEMMLRWVASLDKNGALFNPNSEVGSVIFVRSDSGIKNIKELKGRKISAVSKDAMGGFLLGYKAIYDRGLVYPQGYKIEFSGFPIEQGLLAVKNGSVDAAIVPVCLFENMVKVTQIKAEAFKALDAYLTADGCFSSTPLVNNWSLAARSSFSEKDAQRIQQILLLNDDPMLTTWKIPVGLGETYAIKKLARLIDTDETLWETFLRLAKAYKLWLIGIIFLMILLAVNHLWLTYIARRRRFELESTYHQIHEYEEMLAQADRVNILGEIASGIGHELNQPLMAIRNYAEGSLYGIKQDKAPVTFIQPLERIVEQVEQCGAIIKNLRSWVKPQNQQRLEWFNLNDFMDRMMEIIRLQTKNKVNIDLEIGDVSEVYTIVSILEQVMMNSLLNAVQAGATEILVKAESQEGFNTIFILDNGTGFAQFELDSPFVPFRSSKASGLGLGLVICERSIALTGGKFKIGNREDGIRGAAIKIMLPIKEKDSNCQLA